MATKKTEKNTQIIIKPIEILSTNITLVGDTPLLVHAFTEKAKRQILESQQKNKKDKKAMAIRDPFAEFMDAHYWLTPKPEEHTPAAYDAAWEAGAKFGFPTSAVKEAAVMACYRAGLVSNTTTMKCSFNVNALEGVDLGTGSELALIETDEKPYMREDPVKIGGVVKTTDLRYRPCFEHWKMRLKISLINTGIFTMESIINAINIGGFMGGLGEWRMERDGNYGHFHVEIE